MLHNIIRKHEMVSADREIARQMTVLQYKMARALCFGHVVDAACDAGYGSCFISLNPDVTYVTGLDTAGTRPSCRAGATPNAPAPLRPRFHPPSLTNPSKTAPCTNRPTTTLDSR